MLDSYCATFFLAVAIKLALLVPPVDELVELPLLLPVLLLLLLELLPHPATTTAANAAATKMAATLLYACNYLTPPSSAFRRRAIVAPQDPDDCSGEASPKGGERVDYKQYTS